MSILFSIFSPGNSTYCTLAQCNYRTVPAQAYASAMEGLIDDKAARAALRSMAKGKSPGSDRLPAEFYHAFESVILDDVVRMNHDNGAATPRRVRC